MCHDLCCLFADLVSPRGRSQAQPAAQARGPALAASSFPRNQQSRSPSTTAQRARPLSRSLSRFLITPQSRMFSAPSLSLPMKTAKSVPKCFKAHNNQPQLMSVSAQPCISQTDALCLQTGTQQACAHRSHKLLTAQQRQQSDNTAVLASICSFPTIHMRISSRRAASRARSISL